MCAKPRGASQQRSGTVLVSYCAFWVPVKFFILVDFKAPKTDWDHEIALGDTFGLQFFQASGTVQHGARAARKRVGQAHSSPDLVITWVTKDIGSFGSEEQINRSDHDVTGMQLTLHHQ